MSYQEKRGTGARWSSSRSPSSLVFLVPGGAVRAGACRSASCSGPRLPPSAPTSASASRGSTRESYVNNVFAQIGLIMLIGLAAKNAILIVEFAKMLREQGKDPVTAALEAARLRFRPILMTAFAFILGVVPLLTASGAGAEGRKVMGMAVFCGMLIATFLAVFLDPRPAS